MKPKDLNLSELYQDELDALHKAVLAEIERRKPGLPRLVRFKPTLGHASGGRAGWLKAVQSIDPNAKNNGYAFQGEFLADGHEVDLEVGTVLLECNPEGSAKSGLKSARVLVVTATGRTHLVTGPLPWPQKVLTIRDQVAALLAMPVEERLQA